MGVCINIELRVNLGDNYISIKTCTLTYTWLKKYEIMIKDVSLHKKISINKQEPNFAILPKRQFHQVHVYIR